jgi:hypothetical protein
MKWLGSAAAAIAGLMGLAHVLMWTVGSAARPDDTLVGGSVNVDAQGWAFHPAIAAGTDGSVYVASSQHARPDDWRIVGIYVKRWAGDAWQSLGGRIGHVVGQSGAIWPEGYGPSLVLMDRTPYLGWYEAGGYGWGKSKDGVGISSSVFVAHWDGASWVPDPNAAMPNGALNSAPEVAARTPRLAVISGVLQASWIEARFVPNRGSRNVVVVKQLARGQWIQVGRELRADPSASRSRILDLALADGGGVPLIAWSELHDGGQPSVFAARFDGAGWVQLGKSLNTSRNGFANHVALAVLARTPYVAWQEKTLAGNYKIFVRSWNGAEWALAGDSLNVDPERGEAGRPALAVGGSRLWLAWTEGRPGERAGLYVRSLDGGAWSAPVGPLNIAPGHGAADGPALAAAQGAVFLAWAEKEPPPATKQVHVRRLR